MRCSSTIRDNLSKMARSAKSTISESLKFATGNIECGISACLACRVDKALLGELDISAHTSLALCFDLQRVHLYIAIALLMMYNLSTRLHVAHRFLDVCFDGVIGKAVIYNPSTDTDRMVETILWCWLTAEDDEDSRQARTQPLWGRHLAVLCRIVLLKTYRSWEGNQGCCHQELLDLPSRSASQSGNKT